MVVERSNPPPTPSQWRDLGGSPGRPISLLFFGGEGGGGRGGGEGAGPGWSNFAAFSWGRGRRGGGGRGWGESATAVRPRVSDKPSQASTLAALTKKNKSTCMALNHYSPEP